MSNPFLAEIRLFSFNFAPQGWALCNGQLLPINQNQDLYSLLGTTYGGNGVSNFALPDLRGKIPMSIGLSLTLGQSGGESAHTLTVAELGQHNHGLNCQSGAGNLASPVNALPAADGRDLAPIYATGPVDSTMKPAMIGLAGGGQPHSNQPPYLTLNFCIAIQGTFPSPS